ncbi:MAG TPA: PD-(D/E)XK nuclease family protein, partial [Methylomirabilota bacterium]|nr:PD-(D/E)XK nuclease family protein [Methylomirabilota bacterium]
ETVTAEGGSSTKVFDLDAVRARLTWKYPFEPATKETAKTNVSVLRRRATEEDEEARQLFTQRRRVRRDGTLTAAEIGTAHHLFMQRTMFERTGSVLDLRNQAGRLVQEGFLTPAEAAALDYDALFAFWTSEFGRRVAAAPHLVHRELPFTARFSIGELRALGFNCGEAAPDEFVVVQGIVDLAVIGGDGIEILDFKTDRVRAGEAPEKAAAYTPQIRLYAAALRAIYNRPVRRASLHFLATGETLPIVP